MNTTVIPKLERLRLNALTGPETMATGLAEIAPGIATFFIFGPIVAASGIAAPAIILIAGVAFLFHVNSTAEFSRVLPSAGSYVTFNARSFGARVGTSVGYLFTFAYGLIFTYVCFECGVWVSTAVSALSHFNLPYWAPSILIELAALALMVRGIRISVYVLIALFTIDLAMLIGAGIAMVVTHAASLPLTAQAFDVRHIKGGSSGLGAGYAASILIFTGASASVPLSEETKDPRKALPVAVFAATLIAIALYTFAAWAQDIGFAGDIRALLAAPFPFIAAAGRVAPGLADAMYLGGILSAISLVIATGTFTSRIWFNMARDGLFPSGWARLTERWQTPARILTGSTVGGLVLMLILGWRLGLPQGYDYIGALGTDAFVLIYAITNVALFAYFRRNYRASFSWFRHGFVPWAGIALLAYPFWLSITPDQAYPYNLLWAILIACVAVICGVGIYVGGQRTQVGAILADSGESPAEAPTGPTLGQA